MKNKKMQSTFLAFTLLLLVLTPSIHSYLNGYQYTSVNSKPFARRKLPLPADLQRKIFNAHGQSSLFVLNQAASPSLYGISLSTNTIPNLILPASAPSIALSVGLATALGYLGKTHIPKIKKFFQNIQDFDTAADLVNDEGNSQKSDYMASFHSHQLTDNHPPTTTRTQPREEEQVSPWKICLFQNYELVDDRFVKFKFSLPKMDSGLHLDLGKQVILFPFHFFKCF
jgi:hypothetical protein